MAHLFKNKKIREELESYEIPDLEGKIAKVKAWHDSYNNKSLHTKTESQCEQAFNQHFFIEILGYVSFPNETYTIDPKGTADASSQKADAVLGYFSEDKKRVTAVVEIKDVNTSLERSQQRAGNMSPIQQAFKYKPQYKGCAFVIATNFFEIRLFRDDQLDFESFTLETLVNPINNYYEFRKFYYLLNAENFVIKHGKSVTEKLLSEIRIEQEKITKSFYKDYKDLRQSLINNLVKNKKGLNFDTAVEKAQKIIDRIVFISFCEDLDMLPENKLQEVVFHTEKMGLEIPVWDIMKGFFKAIDKGSKKLEIPHGYNGELFKEDQVLDGLFVDDAICKRFVDLGKYDFSEDLSVNILGHIFEQSISDIEELKSFVEEKEIDKKKSKRKKDGIFYTPDYIVDYIVKNSLGAYLEEKEKELMKKHGLKEDIEGKNYEKRALKVYHEYQVVLRDVKVLDPACGSGAFLVKVFDYLLAENKRVVDVIVDLSHGEAELFNDEASIKELLENNIYGVDLNPESVEITKLSLWLKTAIRGKKLVNLKNNIKCGNSLIDDPEVAGDRAFKWEEEFKEIMDAGGFDVIVGNPPYVYAREKISEAEKSYYNEHFDTSEYQLNTFVLFSEKSAKLLKENGYLGFIIPNSILKISSITKLRKFLLDNGAIKYIIQLFGQSFEGVNVETIIFVFQRAGKGNIVKCLDIYEPSELNEENYRKVNALKWKKDPEYRFQVSIDEKAEELLEKIRNKSLSLETYFFVSTGLKAYQTGKGRPKQTKETVLSRPFDYIDKVDEETFPYLDGKSIGRWVNYGHSYWLKYGSHLAEPRSFKVFSQPRILVREITSKHPKSLICTYMEETYLNNLSIINVLAREENQNLKTLLAILNSALISFYFQKTTPKSERKMFPKIILRDLKKIPIKLPDDEKAFSEKTDLMLSLNKLFQEKLQKFLKLIQSEFDIEKISQKLGKFHELDFDEFVKALKLKKLSLDKKEELLEFFEKHKKELVEVKNRIDATDKEIDEMVFDLYGLSDEERGLVLNN